MAGFHVTLLSSTEDHSRRNTPNHFVTKLSHRIELDRPHSVGLTEIEFCDSWFNINTANIACLLKGSEKKSKRNISETEYRSADPRSPDIHGEALLNRILKYGTDEQKYMLSNPQRSGMSSNQESPSQTASGVSSQQTFSLPPQPLDPSIPVSTPVLAPKILKKLPVTEPPTLYPAYTLETPGEKVNGPVFYTEFSATKIIFPGRYTIGELIETLNDITDESSVHVVDQIKNKPMMSYSHNTHRVTVKNGETKDGSKLTFAMSKELADVLGLTTLTPEGFTQTMYYPVNSDSQFTANIEAGVKNLLIYTDIVKHSFVGDHSAQILRVIPLPSNRLYGETVRLTFDPPYYYPLKENFIEVIEIEIRDNLGKTLFIREPETRLELHFKPISDE